MILLFQNETNKNAFETRPEGIKAGIRKRSGKEWKTDEENKDFGDCPLSEFEKYHDGCC